MLYPSGELNALSCKFDYALPAILFRVFGTKVKRKGFIQGWEKLFYCKRKMIIERFVFDLLSICQRLKYYRIFIPREVSSFSLYQILQIILISNEKE